MLLYIFYFKKPVVPDDGGTSGGGTVPPNIPAFSTIGTALKTLFPNTNGYTFDASFGLSPNLQAQTWLNSDNPTGAADYPGDGGDPNQNRTLYIRTSITVNRDTEVGGMNVKYGSIIVVNKSGVTSWPDNPSVFWTSGSGIPGIVFKQFSVQGIVYLAFVTPSEQDRP
jgi:hypothetical protein